MTKLELARRRYRVLRSQGRCVACGRPAEPGRSRCGRHLAANRECEARRAARARA